jgi:hypothetical protein
MAEQNNETMCGTKKIISPKTFRSKVSFEKSIPEAGGLGGRGEEVSEDQEKANQHCRINVGIL